MGKYLVAFVVSGVLGLAMVAPTPVFAGGWLQNGFCQTVGLILKPLGLCGGNIVYYESVLGVDSQVENDLETTAPTSNHILEEQSEDVFPLVNQTVEEIGVEPVVNEYITINQFGVDEAELNARIVGLLSHIHWLTKESDSPTPVSTISDESLIERVDRLDRQLFKFMDEAHDDNSELSESLLEDISDGVDLNNSVLTSATLNNPTLAGTIFSSGFVGIGTSSPSDMLSVAGPVYLDDISPSAVTNRLYNAGGDLYWNGSVLSSSSTGNWAGASGDVYRLTGSVGIGTSTPTQTLTVDGTFSAGTSTIRLIDDGGEVCNVLAYGAVGDNDTVNDEAIANAIASCGEGGTIYFPMGTFRISEPIVLDRPVTIRGAYSPRWSYSSTLRSSIRADFNNFTGAALIHVRDRSISGEAQDNNGGRIEHISIDGGSVGTDVTGVYFEGLVRDWKLTDVDISQTSGNGFEAAVGNGSGNPRGFTIRGLSIYSAGIHGFRATALNDSYIDDLLAVANAERGIYLSSMGETKIANSRAVFNALTGLYIDGASNNGGLTFTDFSTDRNDRHGVRISSTGTSTIVFNGLLTRRDGANQFGGGGSETPYAGLAIIGSSTNKVAPVFVSGLAQTVGLDDSQNPPLAPLVGVRVTNATYVKIDGQLWGVDDAWLDGGGNDHFIIEDDAILKTGTAGDQEIFTSLRKWQATSTDELFFGNRVSIGSSTDSRLFNIVAPSQAGARFRDTTNNVTFDMRAEDFQAFFGTFSNHQLRFQTNNTSRLTIDTNGNVGIGTTSPSARLTVAGTVRFSTITGGTLETDALGNVMITSDERLKDDISPFKSGLTEILGIDPILYRWSDESGYDQSKLYAGFSAQDIEDYIPEAIGENPAGFKTLSTRPILAAVVNAIKELWRVVTGNQEKISELEQRIEILEAELSIEPDTTTEDEDKQEPEIEDDESETEVEDEEEIDGELETGDSEESNDSPSEAEESTDEPAEEDSDSDINQASTEDEVVESEEVMYEEKTVQEETEADNEVEEDDETVDKSDEVDELELTEGWGGDSEEE